MWPILLALWTSPGHAAIVDRIVVVVEDQLVMTSDIALETELSQLDTVQLPFWTHKTVVERLIDAAVVRERAEAVSLYQPHEDEVRGRVEVLRRAIGNRTRWVEFLGRWGMTEDDLRQVLRRRMVVEAFLRRNISVNPKDRGAWLAASDVLIGKMREHMTIRRVDEEGQ